MNLEKPNSTGGKIYRSHDLNMAEGQENRNNEENEHPPNPINISAPNGGISLDMIVDAYAQGVHNILVENVMLSGSDCVAFITHVFFYFTDKIKCILRCTVSKGAVTAL